MAWPSLPVKSRIIANVSGITAHLTAKHLDQIMDEGLHEHTWAVTAFWPSQPLRDGRPLKLGLEKLLSTFPGPDGVLPPDLWSAEAIAVRVTNLLGWCVGARVARPDFGEVWFWR